MLPAAFAMVVIVVQAVRTFFRSGLALGRVFFFDLVFAMVSMFRGVSRLTTIRRKFVSPISVFAQEALPAKRKHEFVIIRGRAKQQAEIARHERKAHHSLKSP